MFHQFQALNLFNLVKNQSNITIPTPSRLSYHGDKHMIGFMAFCRTPLVKGRIMSMLSGE